ncbi:unnamed protein product [Cercopithifilaria johnstoni]|nr:unnamed protein product [Cercopithifilaria johnstoni]
MSRSMVLVAGSGSDSSGGSSQPSTPDNTPNYRIGSRSPLMYNPKMVIKHIPLSIAAQIPTIERNSTSRRTVIASITLLESTGRLYEGHHR